MEERDAVGVLRKQLREVDRELSALKSGTGGSVFLGSVTAPAISLAVPAIKQVSAAYPGIEVNVRVETSNVLARELLAARQDFIIARVPDDLNPRLFNVTEIGIEKACLIVRKGHPLTAKPRSGLPFGHPVRQRRWRYGSVPSCCLPCAIARLLRGNIRLEHLIITAQQRS